MCAMLSSSQLRLPDRSPFHGRSGRHRDVILIKDVSLLRSARNVPAFSSRMTVCPSHLQTGSSHRVLLRAVCVMSPAWQGHVIEHVKMLHTSRLLFGKVSRLVPCGASGGGHQDLVNERERQIMKCEAAPVEASVHSVDAFGDVYADDTALEKILQRDVHEPYADFRKSETERSRYVHTDAESVQDGLSSNPIMYSGTRVMNISTVNGSTKAPQEPDIHVYNSEQSTSTPLSASDTHLTSKQKTKFWQIVDNDIAIMKSAFKEFQETGLPYLTENVQKIVALRWREDSSARQAFKSPAPLQYEPGLSGLDLVAVDLVVLKSYFEIALGWLKAWQIPLEQHYEPDLIAGYFNRRPHILLFRILQVSAVFGNTVFQLELEKLLKPEKMNDAYAQRRGAELFKEALIALGPTFVKVGQSLSTRPDLIGSVTAKVLAELQDNLPPFPTREAVSIIEGELGAPIDTIFPHLSESPVAAASFGQVYKGTTIDGKDVAVKVQRPDLLHSIALDIYILRMGLAVLRKIAKRRSDLKLYADELGHGFFGELDYIQEANNAKEFQEAHSKLTFLEVPKTIQSLSTRRVLTMEWVDGERPGDMLLLAQMPNPEGDGIIRDRQLKAKQRLFSLVNKGVEASLVQLFDTGILHADPHPGNLLYTEGGQMVFLDFGLMCRVEKSHQLAMMASVAHIVNADWESFVQDLADMEVLPAYVNRRTVALELVEALGDVVPQAGVPDIKFSKVLVNVLAIALKNQFKMPPYFVLVLRSIASLEGLALAVDPDFKVFASSYPFVLQKLLTDNSIPLRRILSPLVLDHEKRFRWERLASFATLAQQHALKRVALETGMELQPVSVTDLGLQAVNPELMQLLVNLILSEKGVVFRQLILEADTYDLARTFNSSKAAALRKNMATAMAGVFYQMGRRSLRERANITFQDPTEPKRDSSASSLSQEAVMISEKTLVDDIKTLTNCPDTIDISLLRSQQMQMLLQVALLRLRRRPLLLVRTGWTGFTMLCYAFALAAHRLVVALCFKRSQSNSELSLKPDYRLATA